MEYLVVNIDIYKGVTAQQSIDSLVKMSLVLLVKYNVSYLSARQE